MSGAPLPADVLARAGLSRGSATDRSIHALVARVVRDSGVGEGTLIDVGCGSGSLAATLAGTFTTYIGCDIVAYDGFPQAPWASFVQIDLERPPYSLPDASGDVVAAVETIEHLENPRSFVRELARIARPGGLIVVTTPNQLSLLSKVTLVFKDHFNAFQERPGLYPSHITAVLAEDLRRIARECRLSDIQIRFTNSGRIPLTPWRWPAWLGFRGASFSDNVLLAATRGPE